MEKKIYYRTGWFLLSGAGFFVFLYRIFFSSEKLIFMDYLVTLFGGFIFSFSLFHAFYPILTYDENGCETNVFLRRRKHYKWIDVKVIFRVSSDITWMNDKSDKGPMLGGKMFTRHYQEHITSIVEFVQRCNPNAKIDPYILKTIEERKHKSKD